MLILPCYARRRGLGLRDFHDRCEILIKGLLKVATLIHIWVDWLGHPGAPSGLPGHLENPVLAQGDPGGPV